jgi:hypothetical protein
MELEEVRAAWQREKAAYTVEGDTKKILANTMKQVRESDLLFACQQGLLIVCGLIGLGLMARFYSSRNPLLSNAGMVLMFLSLASMVAGIVIFRQRQRISHPWLPTEDFLAKERSKIAARIALLGRNLTWFLIPSVLGFLLWWMPLLHTIQEAMMLMAMVVFPFVEITRFYRKKVRNELRPMLEKIDQDLVERRNRQVGKAKLMPDVCEFE